MPNEKTPDTIAKLEEYWQWIDEIDPLLRQGPRFEVDPTKDGDLFTWMRPSLAGTAGRLRIGVAKALVGILNNLPAILEELKEARERVKLLVKWVNCGGGPSGRVCTYDPKDHHEIYGGGTTQTDGTHICTIHDLHKSLAEINTLKQQLSEARVASERLEKGDLQYQLDHYDDCQS